MYVYVYCSVLYVYGNGCISVPLFVLPDRCLRIILLALCRSEAEIRFHLSTTTARTCKPRCSAYMGFMLPSAAIGFSLRRDGSRTKLSHLKMRSGRGRSQTTSLRHGVCSAMNASAVQPRIPVLRINPSSKEDITYPFRSCIRVQNTGLRFKS